jgi:hypothetical protein
MYKCNDCKYLKIEKDYEYKRNIFLFKKSCECNEAVKNFIRYYYRVETGKDLNFYSSDSEKKGKYNLHKNYLEINDLSIFKMIIVEQKKFCPYFEESLINNFEDMDKEIEKWNKYYFNHKWNEEG